MITLSTISGKIRNTGRLAIATIFMSMFSTLSAFAQEKIATEPAPTIFSNPVFILLISIAILLLLVIVIFAKMVTAAAVDNYEKKKGNRPGNFPSSTTKWLLIILSVGGLSNSLFAQTEITHATLQASSSYWGLDSFTFFSLLTLISLELFIAWFLYDLSMTLLGVKELWQKEAEEKERAKATAPNFLDKFNASVAIEQEAEIMTDHDYDGIRELDNNLPPWWVWGFFVTVVFAFVYMIHYQVLGSGMSPEEEYEEQIAQGKADVEEYRKRAANLVDENNATLLTDKASLESGSSIYIENCAPCHGKSGEGSVGPNLTDDYWIHKGGIKDIFRSIKFGWPEKGMKAWDQDLGAKQIHELSSYIKSLGGTNPPNPKEAQGELYVEEGAKSDSTVTSAKDTLQVALKDSLQNKEAK